MLEVSQRGFSLYFHFVQRAALCFYVRGSRFINIQFFFLIIIITMSGTPTLYECSHCEHCLGISASLAFFSQTFRDLLLAVMFLMLM